MIDSIFILYLIISANFLAQLFPCKLRYLLSNNMIVKHVFSVMTLLFFVVSANTTTSFSTLIKNTLILYIWFMLTTKMHSVCVVIFLIVSGFYYILQLYKNKKIVSSEEISNDTMQNIEYLQRILFISLIVLTIIGVILYVIDKKNEYGENFTLFNFLFKIECNDDVT